MSYEIVKSINEKERSIIYAANNIRPLWWYKTQLKEPTGEPVSKETFIKEMISGAIDGSLRLPKGHKYEIIARMISKLQECADLSDRVWHSKSDEEHKQAKEIYYNFLLNKFNEFDRMLKNTKKEKCIVYLKDFYGYFVKNTSRGWRYSNHYSAAKIFKNEIEAIYSLDSGIKNYEIVKIKDFYMNDLKNAETRLLKAKEQKDPEWRINRLNEEIAYFKNKLATC